MRNIWFILAVILISVPECLGQVRNAGDDKLIFNGIIRDAATSEPLGNSQIFINKSFNSVSSQDGTFAITVNRGDTVVFRLLGYQPSSFLVSDTLAGRDFLAGIYMNSDTLAIGEVVIVPRLVSLKTEIFKPPAPPSQEMENAKYNMAVSAYQGRVSIGRLGDPASNYAMVHQQMRRYAFEKGTIPSDRIVGFSPFMLIPAAYLLMNGLPQKPGPMKPDLTEDELQLIHRKYLESKGIR